MVALYIPLLCTLLRLPGKQQHCQWTLSAEEDAHISSLVPSHSRSQRGRANLELQQRCLSLKVIDTCFMHEPHLLENRQAYIKSSTVQDVFQSTKPHQLHWRDWEMGTKEEGFICYQLEFDKKKLVKVGKSW